MNCESDYPVGGRCFGLGLALSSFPLFWVGGMTCQDDGADWFLQFVVRCDRGDKILYIMRNDSSPICYAPCAEGGRGDGKEQK